MKKYAPFLDYQEHMCIDIKTAQSIKEKPSETKDEKEDAPKEGQAFAKAYKETKFYDEMDDTNKKAVNVMAEQGLEEAVKHMFTDEKSGRQLSYAEMRSLYG